MTAVSAIVSYVVFAAATVVVLAIWLGLMAVADRAHQIAGLWHRGQRGGIFVDILIAIGAVVLAGVILGAACGQCVSSAGAQPAHPTGYHRGPDRDCDQQYGECDQRQQHRGNFSPGPFDRSPVDIHDNQICISPDCSGSRNSPTTTTTGGRGDE